MKVFLSWSGHHSHKVACALREWLPSVIQLIVPYVSSEDIDKGTRWSTDIAKELEASHYGIICITKENLSAPWINFEAGALSKSLDKANVSPFLIDVKRSEVQGPLLQFQSVIWEKEELWKLLSSINNRIPEKSRLADPILEKAFDVWWPQLDSQLKEIERAAEQPTAPAVAPPDEKSKILEELLELVRQQQRILNDPEKLLPPQYVDFILRRSSLDDRREPEFRKRFAELHEELMRLSSLLEWKDSGPIPLGEVAHLVARMHTHFHEIEGIAPRRRRAIPLFDDGKKE